MVMRKLVGAIAVIGLCSSFSLAVNQRVSDKNVSIKDILGSGYACNAAACSPVDGEIPCIPPSGVLDPYYKEFVRHSGKSCGWSPTGWSCAVNSRVCTEIFYHIGSCTGNAPNGEVPVITYKDFCSGGGVKQF
jgi:hypothetical protein